MFIKVYKILFSILIICLCISCADTYLLKDGYTKVLKTNERYVNPEFNNDVFKVVDTNFLYKESYTVYMGVKETPKNIVLLLRFYPNGLFSRFSTGKEHIILNDIGDTNLDFRETGTRGYYYYKEGVLHMVSFGTVGELYTFGSSESYAATENDLLKLFYRGEKSSYYYEKIKLPEKWQYIKPDKNWESSH